MTGGVDPASFPSGGWRDARKCLDVITKVEMASTNIVTDLPGWLGGLV